MRQSAIDASTTIDITFSAVSAFCSFAKGSIYLEKCWLCLCLMSGSIAD